MNNKSEQQLKNIFREKLLNDDGTIMEMNKRIKEVNDKAVLSHYSYSDELMKHLKTAVINDNKEDFLHLTNLIQKSFTTDTYINELLKDIDKKDIIKEFFENFLDSKTKERLHILIGETGVGKTYIIEKNLPGIIQYASNSSLDPYTLCYTLEDRGNGLQPYETPFLDALKNGKKVFLDEMNELPQDTLMFLQGITDEKESVVIGSEIIKIHDDFRIIGSLNPPSATDERRPLGDALLGRAVGIVLELTDDLIAERIGCSKTWINKIRELHSMVRNTNLVDVRSLTFRDFQRFFKYNFEEQYKFKVCMGDVTNIKEYNKLATTQEFQTMLKSILMLR